MTEKIKVGGVIQNDQLASISVLAVKDRPGSPRPCSTRWASAG